MQQLSNNEWRLWLYQQINGLRRRTIRCEHHDFCDDSYIYLHGFINKQNFRKESIRKPVEVFEQLLHSPRVTVWCGLSSNKVYGPYFIWDTDMGNVRTVTTEAYIEMLDNVMTVDSHIGIWFQQDGTTYHASLHARDWLRNTRKLHHALTPKHTYTHCNTYLHTL